MDPLAKSEKVKYMKMLRHPQWRDLSTGIGEIRSVIRAMKISRGETVYDFGSGNGVVVDFLNDKGIVATGIDIVAQAEEVIEAPLWELPRDLEPAEYGVCFDVLQALPTEKVPQSLASIARVVRKEAWFQIALTEDEVYGSLIGTTLHLSVKPIGWWRNQLLEHFSAVRIGQPNDTLWMWAHVKR